MQKADTIPAHSIHDSETQSGGVDSKRMPGEGAEPELDFVNRDCVPASTEVRGSQPQRPQAWHGPLGEALLTGDSTRVHEAIVRAQRAILDRYLQLASGWEAQPEEQADLRNATDVLQALKRATERTPSGGGRHHD
jgi:hypothetical protein